MKSSMVFAEAPALTLVRIDGSIDAVVGAAANDRGATVAIENVKPASELIRRDKRRFIRRFSSANERAAAGGSTSAALLSPMRPPKRSKAQNQCQESQIGSPFCRT